MQAICHQQGSSTVRKDITRRMKTDSGFDEKKTVF